MPRPIYPVLPGWGFSVIKAPIWSTRIQKSISGRELRIVDQLYPIYEFTLRYEFLRDKNDTRGGANSGLGSNALGTFDELRTLMGFFIKQMGSFAVFLFDDPTDDTVTGGEIGVGDGTTTIFQLVRAMGNFQEPIVVIKEVSQVYLNGSPAALGSWTVDINSGLLTFGQGAPAFGTSITADFQYYFLCRFKEDTIEFDNFMYQLWEVKEVKLRSVLNEELIMSPAELPWEYLDLPPTLSNAVFFRVFSLLTTIPPNFVGSYVYATAAPTSITNFNVYRNGTILLGTITFDPSYLGGTTAKLPTSAQTTFNPGDWLTVVPQRSDATLYGLSGSFAVLQ